MDKKVLAICRVSTYVQEIQSQKDELEAFILYNNVRAEDIIWITGIGVSAVKEDDNFKANIAKAKEYIRSGQVDCVYAWELSRIARKSSTMALLIDELISYKVNLKIQNPRLELFTNGQLNDGMLLAINLFTTLAEQEMRNKKDRFARARKRDKALGLFMGGHRRFGYDILADRTIVINKEEAAVLVMMYQYYASGDYSYSTLSVELQKQGYDFATIKWVTAHLQCNCYSDGTYPIIISQELWDKVNAVKKRNKEGMDRSYNHNYFANRLIRCQCGYGYTTGQKTYKCCKCNAMQISIAQMDGLLWHIASRLELQQRIQDNKNQSKSSKEKQAVLARKIKGVDTYTAKAVKTQQRAKEAYLNGIIDLGEYRRRAAAAESTIKDLEKERSRYLNELELLKRPVKDNLDLVLRIADSVTAADETEMKAIVRRWVKKVSIEDCVVTIETVLREYKCRYKPQAKICKWYTVGDSPLLIPRLGRIADKASLDYRQGTPLEVLNTTAWLEGSVIV